MSYVSQPWLDFNLSLRLPTYYFYLHDNCSFCAQFKLLVPWTFCRASASNLSDSEVVHG